MRTNVLRLMRVYYRQLVAGANRNEIRGVCFGESTMRRLVFSERRPTSDWGVISCAYAVIAHLSQ
jgi:hypothetical protein